MRRRIFLAIGGTLLAMLLIISLASRAVLRDSYAELESRYIRTDLERVQSSIAAGEASLGEAIEDAAASTALYRFVKRPWPAFFDQWFSQERADDLRIDLLEVLDLQGNVLATHPFGPGSSARALGLEFSKWMAEHPGLLQPSVRFPAVQGMVRLPEGLLLVAARPVRDDRRTLPVVGALVAGRRFGEREVQRMGNRLQMSLAVYAFNGTPLPDAARQARQKLRTQGWFVDTSRPGTASAYATIAGLDGLPAALLQVDAPRDILRQGERTTRFFFIWLVFVGAAFCAVVLLTIERAVLSRLVHLGQSLLAIGTGGDPARRIDISGRDQIAYIGAAINGLLDAQARTTEALRASERRNEAFLDAVPDAIFRVTRDGTIVDARSSRRLPLLEASDDLVGRGTDVILPLYSFLSPELFDRAMAATAAALDTSQPQMIAFHVDTQDGRRWYEERFIAAAENEVIVLVREVTDLKQAEEARRKEVLLKEIHHRVKNNLQVISSLLALQAGAARDEHTRRLLSESRNRVHSMALIHDKLYQGGTSFRAYVGDLAAHLRHSYAGSSEAVTMEIDVQEVSLDMDVMVPCGLIINELLSNALKYAFPGGRAGSIRVRMHRQSDGSFRLEVSDDGAGLPAEVDVRSPRTLGLRIVASLVGQLHGTLAAAPAPGASFVITFPAGPPA